MTADMNNCRKYKHSVFDCVVFPFHIVAQYFDRMTIVSSIGKLLFMRTLCDGYHIYKTDCVYIAFGDHILVKHTFTFLHPLDLLPVGSDAAVLGR